MRRAARVIALAAALILPASAQAASPGFRVGAAEATIDPELSMTG